jgi:anti-sigma B factor antagonist
MSVAEPSHRDGFRPFAISVARDGDETAIAVTGEIDLASSERVDHEVRTVRAEGAVRIVLDLHEVDFIDSTGLRVLLSLRNDAVRSGYRFELVPPGRAARRIFGITGTRGLFDWRSGPDAT